MKGVLILFAVIATVFGELDYEKYLERFGYLDQTSFHQSNVTESLLLFQRTFGLKESGIVDEATLDLMNTPRCGNHDSGARTYRDTAWRKKHLSYYYYNYTPDISRGEVRSIVSQALGLWSAVTPLTFTERQGGDINIAFGSYRHRDSKGPCRDPFDGPSRVLAHAYFPPIGRIHFDESETWTSRSQSGINLLWVSTHEMGHIMGLEHDTVNKDAVMYPYYRKYTPGFHLHRNDIARIQRLYGSKTGGGGGGGSCKDKVINCRRDKRCCSGCGSAWNKYMRAYCAKTCGFC